MRGEIAMAKREIRLLAAVCFLFGMVLGLLLSPVKAGVCIGNSYNRINDGEE